MPRFRRLFVGLAIAVLLVAGAALSRAFTPPDAPLSGVAFAIDGDTIRLRGERVRLLGLDAPELAQSCTDGQGAAWPCGQAARRYLVALLGGGEITCAPNGRDRYGRVLARCKKGTVDVAEAIVRAGLAVADGDYFAVGDDARAARAGIWAGTFELPADWRHAHGEGTPSLFDIARSWFR